MSKYRMKGLRKVYLASITDRIFESEIRRKPNFEYGGGYRIHTTNQSNRNKNNDTLVDIPYCNLLHMFANEVGSEEFNRTISNICDCRYQSCGLFLDTAHKNRFLGFLYSHHITNDAVTPAFAAALYLLTSYDLIWCQCGEFVQPLSIDFTSIDINGSGSVVKMIYQTAWDLYSGKVHFLISQLFSAKVSDRLLRLLLNSFILRRYGNNAIGAFQDYHGGKAV